MDRIGPYNVIGEIGRGGMGIVLHGMDPAIGRPVAIKVILLQAFSDPKDREMLRARLFREAQAAGILSHPGIVTIYYVGEEGENAFIAMEFVNGPTLEKLLSESPPPGWETLRRVLWQTAAALDYAHSKGIIHRDIKPPNIMLDENGTVKICDFGIAKGLVGQSSLTHTGTSLGSPFYMSPEQIQGGDLDYRTDQYSLGVVAYQALAGRRPFQGEQVQSLFFHIMNDPPPVAHDLNPALSPAVSGVLQKVLAKDPKARYASCTEFVRALLEAWDADSVPAVAPVVEPTVAPVAEPVQVPQSAPTPAPKAASTKALIAWLVAAMALGAIGLAAFFYWTKTRTQPAVVSMPAPIPTPKAAPIAPPKSEPITPPIPARAKPTKPTKPTGPPPAPSPAAPLLAIERFVVEPPAIPRGQTALLKWSVKNAAEVKIDPDTGPDIGKVGAIGARSVAPQSATTYKLTAKAANGPARTESVTLQVLSPPFIQSFSASPASIQSGQPVVLRWNVTGAEQVSIGRGIGNVALQGVRGVFPTVSQTYILQATGPGGSASRSVAVSVAAAGNPKIVRFSADPLTINPGESTFLRWEVVNAEEVTIDHGIGRVEAQGALKVSPQITTTYRIFATSNYTFHQDVRVIVKP